MPQVSTSALITDNGRRVLLRLQGRFYDLSHQEHHHHEHTPGQHP